ncbi:NAD(P)-dependent oxidoreductase [Actinomadura roseirufa]|uniref:NAD(P)-dependent oxidoreductase n=1 Tax=Actinomadura roseirufa TaxID=2094049 RepID=UPI0013F14F8C|nr:NAD(P)H-binding protein [Actinomadura roseirufa]
MIFGVTGGTGAQLLEQALVAGHDVTVLTRRRLGIEHAHLTVLRGDVLEPSSWRSAVAGQHAIMSCLGSTDRKNPTTVYSEGVSNILAAMRPGPVRRLICLSSAGVEITPEVPALQRLVTKYVIGPRYKHAYADMVRMEQKLAASDVDWTVVRAPMLTDGPLTGRYRTAANGHLTKPKAISRADLAHYLLTHVTDDDHRKAVVEISP